MRDFQQFSVGDWLSLFWRRKWYFVACAIVVPVLATLYARKQQNLYRSEARIMAEAAAIPEDYIRSIARSTPEERIASIRAQIQSRRFLQQVIEAGALGFGNPGFNMENQIKNLGGNLKIDSAVAGVVTISFTALDARIARDTLSLVCQRLIQGNIAARKDKADLTDQFVENQLRETERDLTAQEEKIKNFKTAHLGELPEQSILNLNTLNSQTTQLSFAENNLQQAKEKRKLLELQQVDQKRMDTLTRSMFAPNPAAGGGGTAVTETKTEVPVTSPELNAKRAKYNEQLSHLTPGHPDMLRLAREISDLEKKLAEKNASGKPAAGQELTPLGESAKPTQPGVADAAGISMADLGDATFKMELEAADKEIERRQKERDDIAANIKAIQGKLGKAPALEQEMGALMRELESLRIQYRDLQNKKFTSGMASKLEADTSKNAYRIIDEANLPETPLPRQPIVFLGIAGGLIAGLGACIGRELLDATLGTEQEAARVLGIQVLASIPEVVGSRIIAKKQLQGGVT